MAYSIDQDEQMLAMFEKIGSEPFVESSNYNEVRNPRPIVESTRTFEGRKVNLEAWGGTEAAPKKNRTAPTGQAKQVVKNNTVSATETNGQITKVVSDNASHEAKNEPSVKGGSFDTAAKSAANAQRSAAAAKKRFEESCRYQKKCDLFKQFVSSLGVDAESSVAAEKIIRKFDELNKKAAFEGAYERMDGRCYDGDDTACKYIDEYDKASDKYHAATQRVKETADACSKNGYEGRECDIKGGYRKACQDQAKAGRDFDKAIQNLDDYDSKVESTDASGIKEARKACRAGDQTACEIVDMYDA